MSSGYLDVIVLNWNGEGLIGPCLDSLLKIEDPPLRVIVVDNGSTDSSAELVRERYPGVKLILNGRNLLFAAGNNVGLKWASENGGSHFLLLNNDTEVEPSFARRMLDAIEETGAGIAGPRILYHGFPRRIWYGGGGFHPVVWIPRHMNIRKAPEEVDEGRAETEWVSGCALLVKKEVIDGIGMLDPSYNIYCEDVDLCLRARRAGWKCVYEPSATVYHKVSSSSGGGLTPFKLENRIVSTWILFRRFRSRLWRVLLFPVHLTGFVLLLAALLVTGRWRLLRGALKGAARVARGG